jgi:tripartite ATP-independent transporter DctM subunit
MAPEFSLLVFPVLLALVLTGYPVAFAMMGTALIFGVLAFGANYVFQATSVVESVASNFVLAAVPLFVFMGAMLEKSGIADKLFEALHLWTKRLPGGLAVGTILMCVIFAAASGVVGATEAVVGLLAVPVMMRHKYNHGLIAGSVCAGGSLGTIIPPSVVVVIMGPLANISVGDLMVGMLIPGLILAVSYVAYILIRCVINPAMGPAEPPLPDDPSFARKLSITVTALVPPLVLIVAVLGSIMAGIAAPTEAAGLGAAGSVVLAAIYRRLSWANFRDAVIRTVGVTAMIMAIVLGGSMMTGAFVGSGGIYVTQTYVNSLGLDAVGLVAIILGIAFLAGFFLDWISIILILLPLFTPLLTAMDVNMVWFCILLLIVLQTSYLTPPMAPAVFYFRSIAPREITTGQMYRGVLPFIALHLIPFVLVAVYPDTVLWLPRMLLGSS